MNIDLDKQRATDQAIELIEGLSLQILVELLRILPEEIRSQTEKLDEICSNARAALRSSNG